jgi:glycosyltransferase involved in cell wall biosynthesis
VPALPPDDNYNAIEAIKPIFKKNVPDVVMATLPDPAAAAYLIAAKAAGVPLVVAEVDDHPMLLSSFEELSALHMSDLILPATRHLQRVLSQKLPQLSKRIGNLLPHSADTTYIQLTKEDRRRLREELRVDTELKMLTQIAPFDRRHDHDTLVEACALLKQQGHDFILLLVGDGPERERIAEKIYALRLQDQVTIMDDPGDHVDILCATDIFSLSIHFECNSIPLIEAMAQGLAIAGTDVPGINDLIRDERSGRLAKPRDSESYAQALIDLLAQEKIRKKLGSVARKCIENRGNLNQFMPPFINTVKKKIKEHADAKKKAVDNTLADLGSQYLELQHKIRYLWHNPDSGFGISEATDLMDGFPIDVQVDVLEKLWKVLSEHFFEHFPLLEMRLLEKLGSFYIDLGYLEGVEKLIENMEIHLRQQLFSYHFACNRFSGLRTHVRLAQLYDFTGQQDRKDFYRLELWEFIREANGNGNEYFHQQNATCLENLGEMKLALREMQKDALGAIQVTSDVPVAYEVPEKPIIKKKTGLKSVALRSASKSQAEPTDEVSELMESTTRT